MSEGLGKDTAILENALRRLEALAATLDQIADADARDAARELLQMMLDLHGLALARMTAIVAAADAGSILIERLIAEPHIRAILLLHGLHPQDAGERLRLTIERMTPEWSARGFRAELVSVDSTAARVRVYEADGEKPAESLLHEIEDILIDAAPDLDDIVIEFEDAALATAAAT